MTAVPIGTRREYRASSGSLKVQLGRCECGAEVIRARSEMLTDHVLLDAEPATDGRLLTIMPVGQARGQFVLACLELDPFEVERYAGEDLFREHTCEGRR